VKALQLLLVGGSLHRQPWCHSSTTHTATVSGVYQALLDALL
jgi:hypothetical protein